MYIINLNSPQWKKFSAKMCQYWAKMCQNCAKIGIKCAQTKHLARLRRSLAQYWRRRVAQYGHSLA